MLHGFLSSSAQWQDNLAALQRVCKPVTIELWGHGQSPAPTDAQSYAPERYVEQLEAIRRELGVAQWFLCGYSIGAGMTIRYAHCFPEHVVGHVFTNSSSSSRCALKPNERYLRSLLSEQVVCVQTRVACQGMLCVPNSELPKLNLPRTFCRALFVSPLGLAPNPGVRFPARTLSFAAVSGCVDGGRSGNCSAGCVLQRAP